MHDLPVYAGLLLAALLAFGFSLLLLGIGVLWSPFAAVMCFNKAESAGLPSIRYALMGALYSVLFLMPLIYLTARMDDKRTPKGLVVLGYVLLYGVIWLVGATTGVANVVSFFLDVAGSHVSEWEQNGIALTVYLVYILSLIVSLFMLFNPPPNGTGRRFHETLPPFAYILPFVLAFGWLAVSAAAVLLR